MGRPARTPKASNAVAIAAVKELCAMLQKAGVFPLWSVPQQVGEWASIYHTTPDKMGRILRSGTILAKFLSRESWMVHIPDIPLAHRYRFLPN